MGAPMPEEMRRFMGQRKHPALAVACEHCEVEAGDPCILRTSGRLMPQPHWIRQDKARALPGDGRQGRKEA